MYDSRTASHEAAHAVVCKAVTGKFDLVRVHEGGGGWSEALGSSDLGPEDRAALAIAGAVGELLPDRLAALKAVRAVMDDKSGRFANDAEWLGAALDQLVGKHSHPRTKSDAALRCAVIAQQIIERDAATFEELRTQLQTRGVASGSAASRAQTPPGRHYMTPVELRAAADEAERDGHMVKAQLMRASADGRRLPGVERRVMNDPKHPLIGGTEYTGMRRNEDDDARRAERPTRRPRRGCGRAGRAGAVGSGTPGGGAAG